MATITGHTTRGTGTVLTAAIYNNDHVNHVTNATNLNTTKLEGATGPVVDGHGVIFSGTTGSALRTLGQPPIPETRQIIAGAGLTGGGNLQADRTLTVAANGVTDAMLVDMAAGAIKGRALATGTGDPVNLTSAQATAILDAFTSALKGLVPASGGGTANFLRADGAWTSAGVTTTSIVKTGPSAPSGFINDVAASISGTVLTITTNHP